MVHPLSHVRESVSRQSTIWLRAIIVLCTIVLCTPTTASAQTDEMVLDNTEAIEQYGIDSTGSWWAITRPYDQFVNMYINGRRYGPYNSVQRPVFSPDGSTWGFAYERNLQNFVRTPSAEKLIACDTILAVAFAQQSPELWVEYLLGDVRTTTNGTLTIQTTGARGSARFDPSGMVVWHIASRGTQVALVKNGVDKQLYDDVRMGGVWSDGRAVYAALIGSTWTIYLGDNAIVENLQLVESLTVNAFGTVLALNGARSGTPMNSYMYTDDYRNAWVGPNLESAISLVLSPCCDLIAVQGKLAGGPHVVAFNSAVYPSGPTASRPVFSYDGAHMAFTGNDGESFVTIDGKRMTIKGGGVATNAPIALAPDAESVAWTSTSTLAVYDIERSRLYLAKMCDAVGRDVVFNRSKKAYQALGVFGGRLFLMSIPQP